MDFNSTKVNALIGEIMKHKGDKCLVYSQWTTMLDLIEVTPYIELQVTYGQPKLKEYGFKWVRLDGKANASKREAAIEQFRTDPTVTVFLISLKAGGVGLTLIEANRVYLLDPWWNVAAEEQAIDRVHRLGQKKAVHVVRFVCKVCAWNI
jgi:SNF2 family DNA or RNA helicase